jgi:hypothetical protein
MTSVGGTGEPLAGKQTTSGRRTEWRDTGALEQWEITLVPGL